MDKYFANKTVKQEHTHTQKKQNGKMLLKEIMRHTETKTSTQILQRQLLRGTLWKGSGVIDIFQWLLQKC